MMMVTMLCFGVAVLAIYVDYVVVICGGVVFGKRIRLLCTYLCCSSECFERAKWFGFSCFVVVHKLGCGCCEE